MATTLIPLSQQITQVTGAQANYSGGTIHLLQAKPSLVPSLNKPQCDALEANFPGYAAIAMPSIPEPYPDNAAGGVSWATPSVQFNCNSTNAGGQSIQGGYITSNAGTLLCAWTTANAFPMISQYQSLSLQLIINQFGTQAILVNYNGIPQG